MWGCFRMQLLPRRGRVSLPSVPLLRKERLLALPFPHFRLGRRHDAGDAFHRMPGNDISLGTAVVLILRSAKWKGLIRLRSFRTAFR